MKFLNDIITENDGVTVCPGRLSLILGVLVFVCLAIYSVIWLGKEFNGTEFGTGYGGLVGGGLAGIWAKSKTDGS